MYTRNFSFFFPFFCTRGFRLLFHSFFVVDSCNFRRADGMRGADKEREGGNLRSKKVVEEARRGDTKTKGKEDETVVGEREERWEEEMKGSTRRGEEGGGGGDGLRGWM